MDEDNWLTALETFIVETKVSFFNVLRLLLLFYFLSVCLFVKLIVCFFYIYFSLKVFLTLLLLITLYNTLKADVYRRIIQIVD